MRVLFHLCVLAVFAATLAQDVSNSTETATDSTYTPMQDGFTAVLGQIAMQKQFSEKYGSILMNIQAYQAWAQVAQQYMQMLELESSVAMQHIFEEDEDLEEDDQPTTIPDKSTGYDELERSTERSFLYAMKYYHLQAGQKLTSAHQSHYENKIKIAMLSPYAAANPSLSTALYLMYYQEAIRTLGAAATLQRHDSLTQWLYYEMIETDEFDNSRIALPETFVKAMNQMDLIHTGLFVQETTYDLQRMYIEYYLQMIMGPLASHAAAANNNAAASFLEEEMTAEPSKPFFSPLMMMGTPYISYMTQYMKFAAASFGLQAAQAFHYGSQIASNPSLASEKSAVEIKKYALHALFQWAYLNLQVNMYDMWGMFTGMPTAHAAAANANAFVQTGEATATQA